MSGTINLALSQQFDMDGNPLSGGLFYTFVAGTTTPQTAFQDTALTIPFPNPITLDASGRIPMFYLADGSIKIRLTNKTGVVIIAADQLLVIGPSGGGGGGGGGVDPTTVMQTGDIKARFGVGTLTGFLRCNGDTFGNAGSGATNASAANQALFEFLYPTSLAVTPPRSGNATNDFNAGSRMNLPDLRGRTIAGMDDMGAAAALRLTSTYFGISATSLGNAGGDEKHTLVAANLAQHAHGITNQFTSGQTNIVGATSTGHVHRVLGVSGSPVNAAGTAGLSLNHQHQAAGISGSPVMGSGGSFGSPNQNSGGIDPAASGTGDAALTHYHGVDITSGDILGTATNPTADHRHIITGVTTDNAPLSAATPHATAMPAMVLTFYIKL